VSSAVPATRSSSPRRRLNPAPKEEGLPWRALAWWVLFLAGLAGLGLAMAGIEVSTWGDTPRLAGAGAVLVSTAYTWALAARTGGRPLIFGLLVFAMGAGVLWSDLDRLRTGAAVLTTVLAAVLAVMSTVPAVRF
jgi:hypothetical protein